MREGFDLFRFPENANLLWFDARRFVAALVRRHRGTGAAGAVSTNMRAARAKLKWLGSYRYAIVNLGADSREDLELRFADVCRHVRFDGPRRRQGMVMPTVNSAALAPSRTNSPQ